MSEVFLNYARIKADLTVSTHKQINVAKNELLQVLINLIKNAHDVILERNIQQGTIGLIIDESDSSILIHICDNAGGISDEIAPKIFEPYFSTKSGEGTGLGLYMSKSIIEDQCQGSLTFYNTATGVCFTITLPLNPEV
jgi:signal transduction histidine kinase